MLASGRAMLPVTLLALFGVACSASPKGGLRNEPWYATRAGSFGITADLGVASGFEVDSTIDVQDPNFPVETSYLSGELEGVFGGALGIEFFVVDDFSLGLGFDVRRFEPHLLDEFFDFGQIDQLEYFLSARYLLPVRWLRSERLRPFLQAKLAYVPQVSFDMTTSFALPDPLNDIQLVSPYSGGSYWSAAAGAGLAYQLLDSLFGRLGFYYEWALGSSRDTTPTRRVNSTGDPTIDEFLDGVFEELFFDVSLEARGWIVYVGVTWYP